MPDKRDRGIRCALLRIEGWEEATGYTRAQETIRERARESMNEENERREGERGNRDGDRADGVGKMNEGIEKPEGNIVLLLSTIWEPINGYFFFSSTPSQKRFDGLEDSWISIKPCPRIEPLPWHNSSALICDNRKFLYVETVADNTEYYP